MAAESRPATVAPRLLVATLPWATVAGAAVAALALALRLSGLSRVAPDPFYDAAVRSMGTSWHDLLFGALEPGGSVAIDKPAPSLWPQVAATKLLGFTTTSLLVPEALAGAASVALVFVLGRMLWGRTAGLVSAAALAVLPVAVLTARSDTPDALATALTLVAAVALVHSARSDGVWAMAGAGAAIGAAFNVKLFQALVPVPALIVLYSAAAPRERIPRLALCGSVALAVGLSWLAVVSTAPGREQPYAFGSSNGSALSAAFGYDGFARLDATRPDAILESVPGPPGPDRLVGTGGDLGGLLGSELVPALILGGAAIATAIVAEGRRRRAGAGASPAAAGGDAALGDTVALDALAAPGDAAAGPPSRDRLAWAGALGVAAWLVSAGAFFSVLGGLQIRYLDALAPAVALALGGGVAALARFARLPAAILAAAVLIVPTIHSLAVVRNADSDSGHLGVLPPSTLDRLSTFLQDHTRGERYELASATATRATPLIAQDGRRVLMLGTLAGHPITPLRTFLKDVRNREVSYVLVAGLCGPHNADGPNGCGPAARWARVHGRNLTNALGLPVYEVHPPLSARR
jgi:4-amino-4-deoxy-L-arabinose transferase-like glycosyltransferase